MRCTDDMETHAVRHAASIEFEHLAVASLEDKNMSIEAILPMNERWSDRARRDAPTSARHEVLRGPPRAGHPIMTAPAAVPYNPFAALLERQGRPLRVAILSDFTRIPYANGAVFQTRALYRALDTCGHQVTLIGPRDPDTSAGEMPPGTDALPSLPLRT
jgi:1,2-diacylglycerol 3-alpha-glucosyltransferase